MKRLLLVAFMVLCAATAQAGPIEVSSSNGVTNWTALVDLSYGSLFSAPAGSTGEAVAIKPHSAWYQEIGLNWISYAKTGIGPDNIVAPTYNTPIDSTDVTEQRQAIVSFTRTFTATAGSSLSMWLWADDTAFMRLDGGSWVPTAHAWAQSTCETNPTSCRPGTSSYAAWTLAPTVGDEHTLEILAYQIGTGTTNDSNPFGIQYYGTVPDGGATLTLLGGALVGLGILRRKFRA